MITRRKSIKIERRTFISLTKIWMNNKHSRERCSLQTTVSVTKVFLNLKLVKKKNVHKVFPSLEINKLE